MAMPHLRPAPSQDDLAVLTAASSRRIEMWEAIRQASLRVSFQRAGVQLPPRASAILRDTAPAAWSLNTPLKSAMSEYIRRVRPTLSAFVELVRGQTTDDYRPNKAILPATLHIQCKGYTHLDSLLRIASEGVHVRLHKPLPRQRRFPRNHPSASARINVLRKNIRKEEDLFRCLVVDADIIDIWPELFVSPFGVVDKGNGDSQVTGRVIHDLSHPEDDSVNSHTDCSDIASPTYEHCSRIAQEISRCKAADPDLDVEVMAGDVATAYRNACTHSKCVYMFAGHIPEDNAIIIDMSAAFGWTGSAGTYSVLGGAVAYIHGSSADSAHPDGFFDYIGLMTTSTSRPTRVPDVPRLIAPYVSR